jgi:hypothetical protein
VATASQQLQDARAQVGVPAQSLSLAPCLLTYCLYQYCLCSGIVSYTCRLVTCMLRLWSSPPELQC